MDALIRIQTNVILATDPMRYPSLVLFLTLCLPYNTRSTSVLPSYFHFPPTPDAVAAFSGDLFGLWKRALEHSAREANLRNASRAQAPDGADARTIRAATPRDVDTTYNKTVDSQFRTAIHQRPAPDIQARPLKTKQQPNITFENMRQSFFT